MSAVRDVGVLGYAPKYASAFYGPFREAVDSSLVGDRLSYQQDPSRGAREALAEVALDVAEGADLIMVKPALPYLDILSQVAAACPVPVAAYQVSGEYAMVEAAAERGWLERERIILETLLSIRRAGASIILSYWAHEAAYMLVTEPRRAAPTAELSVAGLWLCWILIGWRWDVVLGGGTAHAAAWGRRTAGGRPASAPGRPITGGQSAVIASGSA